MTDDEHHEILTALGAYLLGALDESERRTVASHLAGCADCRQQLAAIAGLPGRLGRLDLDDLDWLEPTPAPTDVDAFVAAALREQRRHRRVQRAWQVVGAAAAVVAVVAVGTRPGDPDRRAGDAVAMAVQDGSATVATVATVEKAWGTELHIDARALPTGDGYELWAVSDGGERQLAGAWSPSESGTYAVTGATGIAAADLARIEIGRADGALIASASV